MKGDKTMFENQLGLQEQLDVMKQYGIVFDTGALSVAFWQTIALTS